MIEEVNHDKRFKISIDKLVEKMKKEHQVDLLDRYRVSVSRGYWEEYDLSLYNINVKDSPLSEKFIAYIVDGNTGKTLSEKLLYPGQEAIIESYLQTLKKE